MVLKEEDRVPTALARDRIYIGWPHAKGLLNRELDWQQFRKIVSEAHYPGEANIRKAGHAAGKLWGFLREMHENDLVVIPTPGAFYVARVLSDDAQYDESGIDHDMAYYRAVEWLNDKRPIERRLARASLISRMNVWGTFAYASDVVSEIDGAVAAASLPADSEPFTLALKQRLVESTREEILHGHVNNWFFERLIASVLEALGGQVRIVPRNKDQGADIIATYRVAGVLPIRVAVQAKWYGEHAKAGKEPIQQVLDGMEAEGADFGLVVVSNDFSDEARTFAESKQEEGRRIELINGRQFASIIVEKGGRVFELIDAARDRWGQNR
jgi:predicted Mrr-cat superfamily restriction endonuclease